MILVDFSNTFISAIIKFHNNGENEITEDIARHLVLNSILSYRKRYGSYGQVVLCCDGFQSWRKKVFPYYKASRKSGRDASSLDWGMILSTMNKLIEEFMENLTYPVIRVSDAEGDDCIAILAKTQDGPHVVISNDKDFGQLLKIPDLKQYRPRMEEELKVPDADRYLKELIIRGDAGDGVPNILSDDDTFVNAEKRQKNIMSKKLEAWFEGSQKYEDFAPDAEKIQRNVTMIDFDFIPKEIEEKILDEYKKFAPRSKRQLLTYFAEHRLRALTEEISAF